MLMISKPKEMRHTHYCEILTIYVITNFRNHLKNTYFLICFPICKSYCMMLLSITEQKEETLLLSVFT